MARRSAECEGEGAHRTRRKLAGRLETLDHFLSKCLNYSTCSCFLGASLGALSLACSGNSAFSLRS